MSQTDLFKNYSYSIGQCVKEIKNLQRNNCTKNKNINVKWMWFPNEYAKKITHYGMTPIHIYIYIYIYICMYVHIRYIHAHTHTYIYKMYTHTYR